MKRVISFSLWGSDPIYFGGVYANLAVAPIIYPGWVCRIYIDSEVPGVVREEMIRRGAEVEVVENNRGSWYGLFWRFFPAVDPTIERFISRDTDSRLNVREKAAVDEWINSGEPFHVMRDHRNHDVPILGGMWGCTGGYLPDLHKSIADWPETDRKGCDQRFLASVIWPTVKDHHIGHDEFYPTRYGGPKARRFPRHQPFDGQHVGEIIK